MFDLTDDQKRAAEAPGSAAVTAGAGTGKTHMLARRYLHHVAEHGLSPLSVVAVTFTEKAAAELRSRIRETLITRLGDEKTTAEVEAAQISTMHSLASRICRDFYDLAGIPADFVVLDEVESPLWAAEKFDEAVSGVDIDIAEELGYKWLFRVLTELLRDPLASEKALSLGADHWRHEVENECGAAVGELVTSAAWTDAETTIHDINGAAGDKLEDARVAAVSAMDAIRSGTDVPAAVAVLRGLAAHLGKGDNWPPDGKQLVGDCLKKLKSAAADIYDRASLAFGPDDEEAARRIPSLAAAFRHVRDYIAAAKLREKVLDFNDLEHYALRILRQPEAIEHYKRRWQAFLVDEFQDTNPVQAEILELLTAGSILTIVGDEKQSIYGFRGADIRVFSRVREEIINVRGGIEVPLSRTFRAHAKLVATMNNIFHPVLGDMHQPLDAERPGSELSSPFVRSALVEHVKGTSNGQKQVIEARYIAVQIEKLHREQGVPYHDIAIIGRRWAPLDTYLGVLSACGIPAINAGGGSLLGTREAQDMYAMIGFLADPADSIPLVAVLRSPFFAFSDRVLFAAAGSVRDGASWWNVVTARPEFERAAAVLRRLLAACDDHSAEQVLRLADRLTGYGAVVANLPQGTRRVADLNGFYDLLRRLESRGRGDIFGTARYLRELYETETDIPRPQIDAGEAVTLMTIHKAKGLEWPVVFVPDLASSHRGNSSPILIDSQLGVAFQMEGDDYEKAEPAILKLIKLKNKARELEESRRLLYVAVTRAKDKVFLTSGKEKGTDIGILRPGLDAAEIVDEIVPYDEDLAIAPSPGLPPPFAVPARSNVDPLKIGLSELPVTALTIYAKCPRRFEYQYVLGHPGVGEGFAAAMSIGSLAHVALELDIADIETLRSRSFVDNDSHLQAAIDLANRFRTSEAYAAVRSPACQRETRFTITINGLTLTGIADLVGPDFVLDYKTDSEMHPDEHRFQLWAYAAAFHKEKAFIAYLRHDRMHQFDVQHLAAITDEAADLVRGITTAVYTATPSASACSMCNYSLICDQADAGVRG